MIGLVTGSLFSKKPIGVGDMISRKPNPQKLTPVPRAPREMLEFVSPKPRGPIEPSLQKMSLKGKIEMAVHEGLAIERYLDSVKVWTIGVGVTAMAGADINPDTYTGRITIRHAIDMMEAILPQYEAIAQNLLGPQSVPSHVFDALTSAAYNIGPRLARGQQTRGLVEMGRYGEALMLWRRPAAIISRRKKEAKLADHGIYSGGTIGIWAGGVNGGRHRMIDRISADELAAMMEPSFKNT